MKLKGGIIIIGSLIWDTSTKRKSWRNSYFDQANKIPIKIPIRYGRISSSRMNTYTMIYSTNLAQGDFGQGMVLKIQNEIKDFEALREILENTIRVERDKTKAEWKHLKNVEAFTLNWNWGVVGVSINPKHIKEGKLSDELTPIQEYWQNNLSDFNPSKFSLQNEEQFIDKNGQFKIEWNEELEDLDFVFSTVIQPRPENENYPNADQIALKMYEGNYYSYFIKNVENGIWTKDDKAILELLKSEYSISNYIEKNIEKKADT